MPKPTQEQVVEQLPELNESQRTMLLKEIALYESLIEDKEDLEADIEAMKRRLNRLRADFGDGAKKLSPKDGFFLTLVEGVSSSLDKTALMKAFSITPKQWAGFVRHKPKKAYLLITTPSTSAKEAASKAATRDERDEEDDRD